MKEEMPLPVIPPAPLLAPPLGLRVNKGNPLIGTTISPRRVTKSRELPAVWVR